MKALSENSNLRFDRSFDMPSIPLVLTKIIQLLDDDSTSAHELEELILHDPSLSARILKLANSAFYCFRSEVKTISHAIPLLGINLVKSLAIGVNIFDSFTRGMKGEAAMINRLWAHSFGVGILSQQIWSRRSGRKEGEFGFLCGLLHDLGKVAFFKKDAFHYGVLFSMDKSEDARDMCLLERRRYTVDHTAVGEMLVKQWGLPADLAKVIRYHHDPLAVDSLLAATVAVADTIAKIAEVGYDGDRKVPENLEAVRARLSMRAREYEDLYHFAGERRKAVEDFFETAG